MNAVKPPVSSCSVAQPQQVLDALLVGLDRPVHHRRRRAQAGAMRVAHHVEPLVGGRLAVAVQQLAHAIDENLGAAAGNAVEAGRDQPLDDRRHRQLRRAARGGCTSGGESACSLNVGIALLDRAEQILVPRRAAGPDCDRPAAAAGRRRRRSSRRSSGRSRRSRARSPRAIRPAGRTRRSCSAPRRRSCS